MKAYIAQWLEQQEKLIVWNTKISFQVYTKKKERYWQAKIKMGSWNWNWEIFYALRWTLWERKFHDKESFTST